MDLIRRLDANPAAFHQQLQQELQGQPREEDLIDPKPDLRSEDGKLAYSHEATLQLAKNAAERAARALRKEFSPALEYAQQGRQERQQQAMLSEARQTASEAIAAARQLPYFKEHEPAISEAMAQIPVEVRQRVGSVAALYMAYNKVLAEKVLPTLSSTVQRQTIADMQRSATAGANGTSQSPPPPSKPAVREGNVDDLARLLERKHAEAAARH